MLLEVYLSAANIVDSHKSGIVKKQTDALFSKLGVTQFTASNAVSCCMSPEESTPSELKLNKPNKRTLVAMLEAERIAKDPSVKGYSTIDKLFSALNE